MNSSKLLPILAVAVIAGGIFVFLRGGVTPTQPIVLEDVASASATPETTPIPLSSVSRSATPAVAPVSDNAPGSGLLAQVDSQQQLARTKLEQMESRWAADAYDPATSPAIEESLLQTLEAERMLQVRDQPARVTGLACRSTLCRVEAVFPEGKSGNEWSTRLLMELGRTFGGSELVVLPGTVGEQNLVIYAYRAGHTPR